MEVQTAWYDSPVGAIEIKSTSNGLKSVFFVEKTHKNDKKLPKLLQNAISQLDEYFHGIRVNFDLELDPDGTDFQKAVWKELLEIPFGQTCSYLDIALKLGDKNATRAVGAANGKNPLSIVVPCHRVIGSNGQLTGYAGGIERKKWLLDFESPTVQLEMF